MDIFLKIGELKNKIGICNVSFLIDQDISEIAKVRGSSFNGNVIPPIIEISTKNKSNQDILFAIAHEYGHYLSYKDGYWNEDLISDLGKEKTTKLVFEEEERAWNNARYILQELDVFVTDKLWSQFIECQKNSLLSYCNNNNNVWLKRILEKARL